MIVLTGTVDITNGQTTLTGTGTEFVGSVFAGDAISVDRKTWYRVEADPTSDTALSFSPAFGEATVSGATLYLMPVSESRLTDIGWSAGITALRQRYRSVLNIAGADKTLALDKTGATDDAALVLKQGGTPVAQLGVLGDNLLALQQHINNGTPTTFLKAVISGTAPNQTIQTQFPDAGGVSITGPTTLADDLTVEGEANLSVPLAIGSGGTGAATAAAARANLGLGTAAEKTYQEGSWTPNITFGGGSTGITYDAVQNRGNYIKIGRLVVLQGVLSLTSKGTSTGAAVITNLPFTSGSNDNTGFIGWYGGMSGISGPLMLLWNASPSGPNLYFGGASAANALTDANFTNSSFFWFALPYLAAT